MAVLTIGHSNHPWETFSRLLCGADVTAIIDVRSRPYSRFRQFNGANLRVRLKEIGIDYVYLGEALGGFPNDPMDNYERMVGTRRFKEAIGKVDAMGIEGRPAMMCSEHDPIVCHRFLLVARRMAAMGSDVAHVLRDGTLEPQSQTEDRLIAASKAGSLELETRERALELAYRRQEKRVLGK